MIRTVAVSIVTGEDTTTGVDVGVGVVAVLAAPVGAAEVVGGGECILYDQEIQSEIRYTEWRMEIVDIGIN